VLGSRLIAIATALVLVTSVFARVAVAGIAWGDIDCCCGEHAGDEACGCPDCPAGAVTKATARPVPVDQLSEAGDDGGQ
jgi:hypothetical protein